MSRFIDYAIGHSRLTIATLIFLLCAGMVAYVTIPKEAEPDVKIPIIYVQLSQRGISPEDSERLLLRPFVGGVFGLMTFFALKSGVVALDIANSNKSAYFYILFAFAAGFSERLAQDMLLGPTVQAAAAKGKRAAHEPEAEEPPPASEDELGPATAEGVTGTGL